MTIEIGTVPHPYMKKEIMQVPGTHPRSDLEDHPTVAKWRPLVGEICLCQYDGTNVLQWHARTRVYWIAQGPLFYIKEETT